MASRWQQWKREPSEAYTAFMQYLAIERGKRNYRAVANTTGVPLWKVAHWGARFQWRSRAVAHNNLEDMKLWRATMREWRRELGLPSVTTKPKIWDVFRRSSQTAAKSLSGNELQEMLAYFVRRGRRHSRS